MIKQIFYTSDATPAMNADEWRRIEKSSSIFNALNGITGLCCYDGSGFMQLIEGPPDKSDKLLDTIRKDHCHANLTVRHEDQIQHAAYGEWAMRFCTLGGDGSERRKQIELLLAPSLSPAIRELLLSWGERPQLS